MPMEDAENERLEQFRDTVSRTVHHFVQKFRSTEIIGGRERGQTHFGSLGAFSISRSINTSLGIPLPCCSNLSGSGLPSLFIQLPVSPPSSSYNLALSLSLSFSPNPLFRSAASRGQPAFTLALTLFVRTRSIDGAPCARRDGIHLSFRQTLRDCIPRTSERYPFRWFYQYRLRR